jgi:hypothetical protein
MPLEGASHPWREREVDLLLQRVDKEDKGDAECISWYKALDYMILGLVHGQEKRYLQCVRNNKPLLCPDKRNSFHLLHSRRRLHFDRLRIGWVQGSSSARGIGSRSSLFDVEFDTTGLETALDNAPRHCIVHWVGMNVRHVAQLERCKLQRMWASQRWSTRYVPHYGRR